MSVLRRLANAGAAAADGARAVPRPVFAPVSGVAVLGDAASDRWDPARDVAARGGSAPSSPAVRRESEEPTFDPDRGDAGARVPAAPREATEPRRAGVTIRPQESPLARTTGGTPPATEPIVSRPGDVTSAIGPATASEARPTGASDVTTVRAHSADSRPVPVPAGAVVAGPEESRHATTEPSPQRPTSADRPVTSVDASAYVETIVRPRPTARASWLDRVRSPDGDAGSADGALDRSGSAADTTHPIEVRIGTIEVFEAAAPSSSGRPGSSPGFADYAAVRSYDWGDHG